MLANGLSLLRLAFAAPLAVFMARADFDAAAWCALLIAFAIASDLADGPIARRLGTESARGRALDHTADFATVTLSLFAASTRAALPWLLPASWPW